MLLMSEFINPRNIIIALITFAVIATVFGLVYAGYKASEQEDEVGAR